MELVVAKDAPTLAWPIVGQQDGILLFATYCLKLEAN
jgi:hypothetical protein